MLKLISANFVKDEEHCIKYMYNSIQPYVEESYVLIDDTTTDTTEQICLDYGCNVKKYKFENFGKTWNTLLKWVNGKSDWTIFISPDETIDKEFGEMLLPLINDIDSTDIDSVGFPRRHWADLEKTKLFEKDKVWFPDIQYRLLRNDYPRIHMQNYVHEWPVGIRRSITIQNKEIHHFNAYYKPRINYNWDKMNQLYGALAEKQKEDAGKDIWPNE